MSHLASLLGSIAPEDQNMARMLLDEIQNPGIANASAASADFPHQPAEVGSGLHDETAASINPNAGSSYSRDWDWIRQEGTNLPKWCTFNPRTGLEDLIPALIHFDSQTGKTLITLALPEVTQEATRYWANDSIRVQVTRPIEGIMDALQLSACLEDWKVKVNVKTSNVDEFVMKVANSVMVKLKLDELSLMGNRSYTVVFRQAENWDHITQGHRYSDPKTLIADVPSSRSYKLPTASAQHYSALVGSLRGSRGLEVRE